MTRQELEMIQKIVAVMNESGRECSVEEVAKVWEAMSGRVAMLEYVAGIRSDMQ